MMKRYCYAGCTLLLAALLGACDVVAPGAATPPANLSTPAPLPLTSAPVEPTLAGGTAYPAPATAAPVPTVGPGTPYPPPELPSETPSFAPGYAPPTPQP